MMCGSGPSRTARHDDVNKQWAMQLRAFGLHAKIEVRTDSVTKRRSADTWVENWENGKSAAHDWVITHVWQKEAARRSDPNWALDEAEKNKVAGHQRRWS